jgi:hypothetical protein
VLGKPGLISLLVRYRLVVLVVRRGGWGRNRAVWVDGGESIEITVL